MKQTTWYVEKFAPLLIIAYSSTLKRRADTAMRGFATVGA